MCCRRVLQIPAALPQHCGSRKIGATPSRGLGPVAVSLPDPTRPLSGQEQVLPASPPLTPPSPGAVLLLTLLGPREPGHPCTSQPTQGIPR